MKYARLDPATMKIVEISQTGGPFTVKINNSFAEKLINDPGFLHSLTFDVFFQRFTTCSPKAIPEGTPLVRWEHLDDDMFKIKVDSGNWLVMIGHDRDHLYCAINRDHPKAKSINFNQPFYVVTLDNPDWHRESYDRIINGIYTYSHWGRNHRIVSHFISTDVFSTNYQNMSRFFNLIPVSN